MLTKKILIAALIAMMSMPAFASIGETGGDPDDCQGVTCTDSDDYGTEHQEMDDDLRNNHGMTVNRDTDGHLEIDDGHGNHYSYRTQPTNGTGTGCADGSAVCYEGSGDGSDSLVVRYNTGKVELATGESHAEPELLEHAAQLGFTVVSKNNGVVTLRNTSSGAEYQVRYSPRMTRNTRGQGAGIHIDTDGRIVERYTDGWEQEILPVR